MYQTDAPACQVCGLPPVFQWARLANAAEQDRQLGEIAILQGRRLEDAEVARRYGPLRVAVTGCGDHSLGDGEEGAMLRTLLHSATCGGHSKCHCQAAPSKGNGPAAGKP